MKKKKHPRIIVYVKSGLVQEIKSDTQEVDIEILDEDVMPESSERRRYRLRLIAEYHNLPYTIW